MSEELPLLERDHELALLTRFLDEMSRGNGGIVAVTGEAGIGKTRLVREITKRARPDIRFIEARCNRDVGALPYGPWIQIFQDLSNQLPLTRKGELSTFAPPEFLRALGSPSATDQATVNVRSGKTVSILFPSVEQEKLSLFDTIRNALRNATEGLGLVLFLDDLMWADDATIELLTYVSQRLQNQPILIIGAFRDAEVDPEGQLAKYVYQGKRDKRLKEISLKPLSRQAVGKIVESLLGKDRVSADLDASVFLKTGGNPFFVEELTRSLLENAPSTETTSPTTFSDMEIPATVKTVIRQRLNKLTTDTFRTLTVAAIIGRDFTFDLIRDVTELPDDKVLDQLEEALRARILRERKIAQLELFSFTDAPVYEFLIQEVSLVRRRRYHKRIADLIEEKHPALVKNQPEMLAFHYLHAGDNEKALKYSLLAAENAQRVYAHDDAMKLYQQAIELIDNDPKLEAEVREKIAVTSFFIRSNQFEDHFEKAIEAFRKLNQPRRVAALYIVYSMATWFYRAAPDEAERLLVKGLAELGNDLKNPEAAGLNAQIARMHAMAGRTSEAIKWGEKAAEIAKEADAPEPLAQAYQTIAISLPITEKERIIKLLEDAMRISRENDLTDALCRSHVNLGYALSMLKNDFEKAINVYSEGVEEAKRRGFLGYRLHLGNELAYYCYIRLGRYDEAEKIAQEDLDLAGNLKIYQVYPQLILGHVHMVRGDYSGARSYFERALPLSREIGWTTFISDNLRELGTLSLETNDLAAAGKWLEEAHDYLQRIDDTTTAYRAEILFHLGRLALQRDDLPKAEQRLRQIEEFSNTIRENWVLGFQAELEGCIALEAQHMDQARKKLNDALAVWESTHQVPNADRVKKALQIVETM